MYLYPKISAEWLYFQWGGMKRSVFGNDSSVYSVENKLERSNFGYYII